MKKSFRIVLIAAVAVGCMVSMCGRKKGAVEKPVVVLGKDTLTAEELTKMSGDTALTPAQIRRTALLVSLAKKAPVPADTARFTKDVDEISEQMSLRSGRQWTRQQVASLLQASRALKGMVDSTKDAAVVMRHLDSLFRQVIMIGGRPVDGGGNAFPAPVDMEPKKRIGMTETEMRLALASIVGRAFQLPPELADIVAGYAFEDEARRGESAALSDIVKGLVYDPSKEMRREKRPEIAPAQRDNSAVALRYRTRASIMDSIGRHLPYLEAIYKRQLKIHQTMSGTVIVSFRVDAGGKVMAAHITRSDIREKDFIDPFLEYVRSIRFRPIPEQVGPMTFEFPFEFKAED